MPVKDKEEFNIGESHPREPKLNIKPLICAFGGLEEILSTRSCVIPSYQGHSIIFHNDYSTLNEDALASVSELIKRLHFIGFGMHPLHAPNPTNALLLSLGQALGPASCIHPHKDRKSCSPSKVAKRWRNIPVITLTYCTLAFPRYERGFKFKEGALHISEEIRNDPITCSVIQRKNYDKLGNV